MIARPTRTDTTTPEQSDAPVVRPAVRELAPSAPAPVRPECSDPSGFGFTAPAVQQAPASVPARRPARSPQGPPRWPHIAVAIIGPAAGVAGFLAAFLSSTMPFRVLTYAVIGGVVIVKVAGPIRSVLAAAIAAIAKIGSR
jgi:hypothetical protein